MLSTLKSVKKFKLPNISENLLKINKFPYKINYKHNFKSLSSPIKFNKFGLLDNHKTFSIYKNYLHSYNLSNSSNSSNTHLQTTTDIQVDEQIKMKQENEQIKTEQVNEQIKTEQVNAQSKTEQVNEQIKTEQVNAQSKTEHVNAQEENEPINWYREIINMIIAFHKAILFSLIIIIGILPFGGIITIIFLLIAKKIIECIFYFLRMVGII